MTTERPDRGARELMQPEPIPDLTMLNPDGSVRGRVVGWIEGQPVLERPDRGARALAERLDASRVRGDLFARGLVRTADAILANGAVFLPDGAELERLVEERIAARNAEADAILDEPAVAAALRKWSDDRRVPSIELLARASAEHYEEGDGYNARRMDAEAKAEHHWLYCMVEAKRWHAAIAREYTALPPDRPTTEGSARDGG